MPGTVGEVLGLMTSLGIGIHLHRKESSRRAHVTKAEKHPSRVTLASGRIALDVSHRADVALGIRGSCTSASSVTGKATSLP